MACLLDTGVLLRLVDSGDPLHAQVRGAVATLVGQRDGLFTTTQNIAEFWNVSTRPIGQNGLALSPDVAATLLEQLIEPVCALLVEQQALYGELKRLVTKYDVIGKQVHDARIVAMMLNWRVDRVLTLNDRDFRRFAAEGIVVVTPAAIAEP